MQCEHGLGAAIERGQVAVGSALDDQGGHFAGRVAGNRDEFRFRIADQAARQTAGVARQEHDQAVASRRMVDDIRRVDFRFAGDHFDGHQPIEQIAAEDAAHPFAAAQHAGSDKQLHLRSVAVRGGEVRHLFARGMHALGGGFRRFLRAESGVENIGDFVIDERLDGIVEYLSAAIGRFQLASRRGNHDNLHLRRGSVQPRDQAWTGFADRRGV